MGNVDGNAYTKTPDWLIPLSPRGMQQARELGRRIKEIVGDGESMIHSSVFYTVYILIPLLTYTYI
jgi:broad specificity phosphatase PhoE